MSETRVMTKGTRGASGKKGDDDRAGGGVRAGGRTRKRALLFGLVVLLAGVGAAWFLLLGPGAGAESAKPASEPEVELGEVLAVEPVSINLADGGYLKLGLGLQLTADVEEAPDGSKALDAAISLYSGRSTTELSDPAQRDALKEELTRTVEEAYHDEVVDVYFTEYVMQ